MSVTQIVSNVSQTVYEVHPSELERGKELERSIYNFPETLLETLSHSFLPIGELNHSLVEDGIRRRYTEP